MIVKLKVTGTEDRELVLEAIEMAIAAGRQLMADRANDPEAEDAARMAKLLDVVLEIEG